MDGNGETTILYYKGLVHHPAETTIYKQMAIRFQVFIIFKGSSDPDRILWTFLFRKYTSGFARFMSPRTKHHIKKSGTVDCFMFSPFRAMFFV